MEEKRGFLESAVKQILYGSPSAPRVTGKTLPDGTALFAADGELDADASPSAWPAGWRPARVRIGERTCAGGAVVRVPASGPVLLPLVARTPYFCSGCPHNTSTKVPAGSLVGGGIGCHALVLMMAPDAVGDVVGPDPDGRRGRAVDRHGPVPEARAGTSCRTSATGPSTTPAAWPCAPRWPPA